MKDFFFSSGFSSVQSFGLLDRREDMRDDSAEILFQSFLRETIVGSSGMGRTSTLDDFCIREKTLSSTEYNRILSLSLSLSLFKDKTRPLV